MKTKKNDINFKRNLRMYLELAKPYKWLIVGIVLSVIVMSLMRIADKFIFKVLVDEGTNFASGNLTIEPFTRILLLLVIAFISVILVKTTSQWLRLHFTNHLAVKMIYDVKIKFFSHIVHLDHEFHTTHKTGSMISRVTRGSWALDGITDFFVFNGLPLVMQLIIGIISVIYFDVASAIVIIVMSILFITFSMILINQQRKLRVIANDAEDAEKANIGDVFTNIDSIKYYGKEDRITNIFSKLASDTSKRFKKNWDYFRWLEAGQNIVVNLGLLFLILFPMIRFLKGDITIGTVVFLYTVFATISEPLYGFIWGVRNYYESMANLESLFRYMDFKNTIKDKENAEKLEVKSGEIEFRNVNFKYKNKDNRAIHNFNLKINKNERIALVGHSGCGKTTLVKLLYRLYDIDSGRILIDNTDTKDFRQESLRGELSIVPQEAILFDDTIYNNILFSNPDADKKQVERAIKFAQLDKFIESLPKKENTIVGERGVKLSGGEKQRVSIARAILADKKILVLDEATSALDSKTESEIQTALVNLMKDRTSIIIAHRLSTIMHANRIIVMDKGRIVQIGTHKELIRERGIYRELWNLQKGGYLKE